MAVLLNLSGWIERRRKDVGPYADVIIHGVAAYENEIKALRGMAYRSKSEHINGCDCIQCVPF